MTPWATLPVAVISLALVLSACANPVQGAAERGSSVAQTTTSSEVASTSETLPATTAQESETSSSLETSTTSAADVATEVITVSPFDEQSRLRWPVDTSEDPIDGFTCEQSPLRPGMLFECGPSAAYLPACWPMYIEDDSTLAPAFPLYCMRSPLDQTVIEFHPADQEISVTKDVDDVLGPDAIPWSVVLDNGAHCAIRIGGAWGTAPDGFVYSYGCDDDHLLLARESDGQTFDRSGSLWIATAQEGESPEATEVSVTTAYFAGPSPVAIGPRLGAQCPDAADLSAAAAPDWVLEPNQAIVCADDWAVATGRPAGADQDLPSGPRLFSPDGEGWKITPEADFCTDKQGVPLALLVWCYAS